MAERRMFAKTIIDSDAFIDMPLSTQALYFHLSMRADDDGFINKPKNIMRMIGASEDDFKLLCVKRFIIAFDSGVIVIKHWKIHNYIQKDRYKPTVYADEKAMISVKENGVYTECIQNVSNMDTQVRLGKVREELGEYRVVECSEIVSDSDSDNVDRNVDNFQYEYIGGVLGKGVVLLTEEQQDELITRLGVSGFDHYVDKLSRFIIDKSATVRNHYETILKWAEEDSKV